MTVQKSIPCMFRRTEPTEADLEKIRQDAGNPDLTAADVVVFGKSMIGRSDIPGNGYLFTADSLKTAAPTFIGKASNLDHKSKSAAQQVARVFDAWTEDVGGVTYLYVNEYAVKTADLADIHTRIFNRQHRERSMGTAISKAHCSVCRTDVIPFDCRCPKHSGQSDYLTVIDAFEGEHVSFVGDPAIEGAQLLNSKGAGLVQEPSSVATDETARLHRLAEDGQVFRDMVKDDFAKWYRMNNRGATLDEVSSLCERLSAKEMMTFARIEKDLFHKVIPSGQQQLSAPEESPKSEEPRSAEEIRQSFKRGL